MVPVDCAEDLGKAILAAANGDAHDPPGWWHDFIKQYEAGAWRQQDSSATPALGLSLASSVITWARATGLPSRPAVWHDP